MEFRWVQPHCDAVIASVQSGLGFVREIYIDIDELFLFRR